MVIIIVLKHDSGVDPGQGSSQGWEGHLKLKKNQCNLVLTKINLEVNGSFTYVLSHVDLGF
jgi:hypothetical protein